MKSEIVASSGGITFAGPDAVELFRATTLRSAVDLATKGIKATRGFTLTKGLAMCERYTGRKYKRTEAAQAIADLTTWIETMTAALPIVKQ